MSHPFSRNSSTHEEWKIVDKFDSTYWSGQDVQIYANNIRLDEAIQVNYVISEQIRPYYSYDSYVANRIHHGARIIQGEISMNFKRDGYLFSLINLLRTQDQSNIWLPHNSITTDGSTENVPIKYNNTPFGPTLWEQIKGDLSPDMANTLANMAKESNETIVNSRESSVQTRGGLFETKLQGFDINIVFGANLDSAQTLRIKNDHSYDVEAADAYYQQSEVSEAAGVIASTGIKLIGVSIAGLARALNDDGRPIIETYSFQARDIVILKNVDPSKPADQGTLVPPITFEKQGQSGNGHIGQATPNNINTRYKS